MHPKTAVATIWNRSARYASKRESSSGWSLVLVRVDQNFASPQITGRCRANRIRSLVMHVHGYGQSGSLHAFAPRTKKQDRTAAAPADTDRRVLVQECFHALILVFCWAVLDQSLALCHAELDDEPCVRAVGYLFVIPFARVRQPSSLWAPHHQVQL